MAISISLEAARSLEVTKQHLAGKLPQRATSETILSTIRDLCYIQWDPTDTVAPSHVIALWSRLGNRFRPSDIDRLLWGEKKLFLHWTPMAAIVLVEDYPIYSSMMRRYHVSLYDSRGGAIARTRKFLAEHKDIRKRILSELKKRGPLQLTQFQGYVRTKRTDGWSSGSDVSNMLHYLLVSGEVMVVGHQGIQNIWGLPEEFLPAWVDRKELTEEEFESEAAQRAIRALGTASPREIYLYFPRDRYLDLESTLASLEKRSIIHRVHIEELGARDERYVHDSDLDLLESIDSDGWEPRMSLLAPFDNLLGDRARTRRLFSFDYIHENYLPPGKRKFGTFVHPILWGDKLIGRVDLRMERPSEELNVLSVHAEPGAPGKEVSSMLAETIEQLGEFLGAKKVIYSSSVPASWRSALHN